MPKVDFTSKRRGLRSAIFLHIQKTAGTSLLSIIRQFYGKDVTSHGDCWNHAPAEFRNVGFVSGHIGYDYVRNLMGERYSFTFLRDPIDRILSLYYFCKKGNPNDFEIYRSANELNLVQFLSAGMSDALIKKNIWNNQVWQLAHGYAHLDDRTISDFDETELMDLATVHINSFDHVGFTESFETDCTIVLKSLGIRNIPTIPRINQSQDKLNECDLTTAEKALLMDLTSLDRKFYNQCKLKFQKCPN